MAGRVALPGQALERVGEAVGPARELAATLARGQAPAAGDIRAVRELVGNRPPLD